MRGSDSTRKDSTPFLITDCRRLCSSQSRKSEYARKWKLPVVNFLWLEECFINARKMPVDTLRYQDLAITPESLNRRVGQRYEQQTPSSDKHHKPTQTTADARRSVEATTYPLQPATSKRKQQQPITVSQDSAGCRSKKSKTTLDPTSKKKFQDMPETFETVSTVHQDDSEKIRQVKRVVQNGLGLPRIRSCEVIR